MTEYIALLKGINVGGHKKVPMVDLRELLTSNGFQDVRTYIQSGNVIFNSDSTNVSTIENTIQKVIVDHFGFEVSVLVKSPEQLKVIFENSPFKEEELKKSYFMMLHDSPSTDLIKIASEKVYKDETYFIINNCIYYFSAKGMGKAKFNANFFERKLQTFITARNYNTMVKLLSLSNHDI